MPTNQATHQNFGAMYIEGSFDLSSGAAVSTITYPGGVTQTCRGDNLTCVKNGTGTYDVTLKGTSGIKLVEILNADADILAVTVATAIDARVASILQAGTGTAVDDIIIKVLTITAAGVAVDTTAAITVTFDAVIRTQRPGNPL